MVDDLAIAAVHKTATKQELLSYRKKIYTPG